MRYSPRQYAEALWEAAKNRSGKESEKINDNFFALLKKNNDLNIASKIIDELEKISLINEGIVSGEIIFARSMDSNIGRIIGKRLIDEGVVDSKTREVRWLEKNDKDLIGGFVARVGEVLIDSSIKGALNKIKRDLVENI